MIRQPTPREAAYAWHTQALRGVYGDEAPMHPDTPQCGWFKRRGLIVINSAALRGKVIDIVRENAQ
jgi:hypothetical protein